MVFAINESNENVEPVAEDFYITIRSNEADRNGVNVIPIWVNWSYLPPQELVAALNANGSWNMDMDELFVGDEFVAKCGCKRCGDVIDQCREDGHLFTVSTQ
jgi:hypothetical protein